jgi:hypothetical protein
MPEEHQQPNTHQPTNDFVEIEFFGEKLSISRREYEQNSQIQSLRNDIVMLHEILPACAESHIAYLPAEFRRLLCQAIQYCAGDTQSIRNYFIDQAADHSPEDFNRLVRVTVARMSSDEVIIKLPNVMISIGSILDAIEDLSHVQNQLCREPSELNDFFASNIRRNARIATARFLNTFFDYQQDAGT